MIDIDHVSKRFGPVAALRDVSLRIQSGERIALVGANGSGKTTLLRAICGLTRVQGAVRIDGVDVAREPERALGQVAYMPQIAPPLEAPVSEVVRSCAALRSIPVADVAQFAARFGFDLSVSGVSRFRDLSGGMKQKLLAAMALAARTPVLVCDEPSANLDGVARDAFFAAVDERPPGSILVLCSHRSEEVERLVDRVVVLEEGRVARDERIFRDGPVAVRSRACEC